LWAGQRKVGSTRAMYCKERAMCGTDSDTERTEGRSIAKWSRE